MAKTSQYAIIAIFTALFAMITADAIATLAADLNSETMQKMQTLGNDLNN